MSSKVRALIVDHVSDIGGAELSLEGLISGIDPAICQYVVALPGSGPLVERLRGQGFVVDLVRHEGWRWWVESPLHSAKFAITAPLQIASLMRWKAYLNQVKPDIIHFNINRLVEPVIAAAWLKIPSVMHFRDIPAKMLHRFVAGRSAFYGVMNLTNCWIANSHATCADIQPYARQPVRVIHNGIDLRRFDQLLAEQTEISHCPLPSGGYHVAMIGGLVPWKRQEDFVKVAMDMLQIRDDVNFYLVGSDRVGYGATLRDLVERMGMQQHVFFIGELRNIPALLARLDLVVHTMPHESFGRVFVEAMAARKPVVAFASGGANEIVVDGGTGVLVPSGDLAAMARSICALLDDPERRRRLGAAGRDRVESLFTLDRHCRAVFDLYSELLKGANQ